MKQILQDLKNFFFAKHKIGNHIRLEGLEKANAYLQELITKKKVPGISVTVLYKGKKLLQKGYGLADIETNTPVDPKNTVFRIASVSKNIAATALAHMVNDQIIDLDASLYSYVPYFPKKKYDFTIRQLASHTAGIRGYQGVEYGLNKPYSIKEGIVIFKDADLLFKPGTGYYYNSFGWVLISLAMQEISGMPFEEYVVKKVFKPLKMSKTYAEPITSASVSDSALTSISASGSAMFSEFKNAIFSRNYSKNRNGFRNAMPVNNYYKLAGGGYLSTSEDIAKLGQAYLDNKILNKTVIEQFLTSEMVKGRKTYYGLGWQVSEDKKGRPYYGHVGNGVGGYANLFVYPEQQMVFSLLTNCTNPNIQEQLDEMINEILTNLNHCQN